MKKDGRTEEEEITIYDASGAAIQDLAFASLVYRLAEEQNTGKIVDL